MNRTLSNHRARTLVVLLTLLHVVSGVAAESSRSLSDQANHKTLLAVADDYWDFYLRQNPEVATTLGENKYNARLSDFSLAHYEMVRTEASRLLKRAQAIDTTGLSEAERLDQQLVVRAVSDQLESIRLKNYEMPINQMDGVHLSFPQIATVAPFNNVADYRNYIRRLNQIPRAIDQVIGTARAGVRDGLVQPRFLLEKTADQCAALADAAGDSSPFSEPLRRIPDSFSTSDRQQIRDALIAAVDRKVRPAYAKLRVFITTEYAPKGRSEPGIWSLPDGDSRYRFWIHMMTTTNLSGEQIHEIGLAQVASLEARITELARSAGYGDRQSFEKAVFSDPKLHGTSRQQILDRFTHYIDQMKPKLPQLFGHLPRSPLVVTSVPMYMEKESSTQYVPGTPDGSRPGQVWVVTYDYATHDMLDDEATAYHEGVPGHHMQIAIAQEMPDLHPFHRAFLPEYNAYVEGWALYSERLGKEVGFYQDPASDLGRLRSELYRALRLVVDTGVHYKRWSRQDMVNYWNLHLPPASDAEMDRYIAWPGQALGYMLGQLKILELRQRAEAELGPRFDIRAFHDEILSRGPMPLDLLESRIVAWIARVKSS